MKPDNAAAQLSAVEPPEVVRVHSRRVACDGVGGALGHPRVYMELGEAGWVECGYCDRRFVLIGHGEITEDEALAPGVYEGSAGH
ncbi:MAG: zinc-finger domain-containing protein [Acetobacteraceae bacterium]|nr:zinc-finger domain-containing protein [Acetobacteraceae bacterium]